MKNDFKKFIALLGLLLFAISFLAVPIAAKEGGTIQVSAKYGNRPVVGFELKAYFCSEMQETGFICVGDFKYYPTSSMPKSSDEWNDLAVDFEGFISSKGITPDTVISSDENGMISFESLKAGLYFFPGAVQKTEGYVYTSAPFFLYLSNTKSTVEAKLKLSREQASDDNHIVRKVLKIWNDQGDAASRPDSITVILYQDGKEYESVELTKETNWSYSWSLPEGHSWSICERTPKGYVSEIHMEGITYTIMNTPVNVPSPPLPLPVLPQTGLIWWPILVFWGLGIVAFLVAFRFRRFEKNDKK